MYQVFGSSRRIRVKKATKEVVKAVEESSEVKFLYAGYRERIDERRFSVTVAYEQEGQRKYIMFLTYLNPCKDSAILMHAQAEAILHSYVNDQKIIESVNIVSLKNADQWVFEPINKTVPRLRQSIFAGGGARNAEFYTSADTFDPFAATVADAVLNQWARGGSVTGRISSISMPEIQNISNVPQRMPRNEDNPFSDDYVSIPTAPPVFDIVRVRSIDSTEDVRTQNLLLRIRLEVHSRPDIIIDTHIRGFNDVQRVIIGEAGLSLTFQDIFYQTLHALYMRNNPARRDVQFTYHPNVATDALRSHGWLFERLRADSQQRFPQHG